MQAAPKGQVLILITPTESEVLKMAINKNLRTQAYLRGKNAKARGESLQDNPYRHNRGRPRGASQEDQREKYDAWEEGWNAG